tara:strand:- start:242 stop:1015 length:774 start_codon:yes stop_codon:yes gene_type:complete
MIEVMLKSLFKKIFNIFNYEIVKKKYSGIIDKREWIPFQYSNDDYKLYFEGLEASKNKQTDNFHKQSRFLDLIGLVKIVLRQNKVEDFVEAGCWKGHSSYLISKLISNHNKNIKLHIFDSFEGLSKPSMGDEQLNKFKPKEIDNIRVQFSSNEDFVKNGVLRNFKFVETYKGWIPEKFYLVENKKFSFVHVDVDLYEPTLKTLEFFFPRLIDGGIIACDDYNSKAFDGAKKAWDQYFSNKKVKFNFSPAMGGSFIVK